MVAVDYDPFADGVLERVVPTTEPQRELWLSNQLGEDASMAYNESVALHLSGPLDVGALKQSLQALTDRHSALRSNFGPDGETLCVFERLALEPSVIDLSARPEEERESAILERKRLAVETPFNLTRGPLFRAELVHGPTDEHLVILTAHHIICDGWSWWVLVRELGALYAQHCGRGAGPLPDADDFAEYALEQARHADNGASAEDERYWLSRFEGDVPVLDLPTDRPRSGRRSFASAREDVVLDAGLVRAVQVLGAKRGVSLFASLLGSFATLLSRLGGQSSVVIGIPTAGQALDGHERLVGHCVNTLPLRFEIDPEQTVSEALDQAQGTLLDALDHQRYTFGTLLGKLKIARDTSRPPLVSVMFNIDQALEHEAEVFPGLKLVFSSNPRSYENFELAINAVQEHGALRVECQYNRDLFDGATVRRWMGYWRTLLQGLVGADADQRMGRLPLLDAAERSRVLDGFNDTEVQYPSNLCIQDLIEAQVERTPGAVAVSHEGKALSFAELNTAANRLAHHLRGKGVGTDALVAVCAERSLELVIGLLAILKAGGAYVPMDPDYPDERLQGMLSDCSPKLVLVQQAFAERVAGLCPGTGLCVLDAAKPEWRKQPSGNPARAETGLADHHLCYVIYTSGSTGVPKGAMNEHRGVVNRLLWMQDMFSLDDGDAVLQKTPFSFDVSVWEFFLPLMTGARLVMARPGGHKDPLYLVQALQDEHITTVHFVPSMLATFLEHGDMQACKGLRRVICSGEALPPATVGTFFRVLPGVGLYNLYGPTEAAVDVTAWTCTQQDAASVVPIGRPVANTHMYILDDLLQPVPVGVAGEIFIGGVQVGRGYLGRDALTRERFLDDPFSASASARMYKTGDLGRWRADGSIEYLGRNDFQVKLRGFRIELGEIESRLGTHPKVAQTAVIAREYRPGDMRLVAYVVAKPGERLDPAALAAYLGETLPEYMVPNHFVQLDAMPLSPNGKLDRKKLPAPQASANRRDAMRTPPRDALEQRVCAAMASALGVDTLGVDEDFFACGGHSLLAARLVASLNRDLDLRLTLRSVFDAPTVARLAQAIRELDEHAGMPASAKHVPRREARDVAPLSLMQQRIWYLEQLQPGGVAYNVPSAHRLRGPMDEQAFERAFREVVKRQSVLRTAIEPGENIGLQRIRDDVPVDLLPAEDLSGLSKDARETALRQRLEALIGEPFELTRAPLYRARLFRLSEDEHVFFFMAHHIIWDGWSFDLLYKELSSTYAEILDTGASSKPPLAVEYGDYASWHKEWMQGEELARQLAHWRKRLAGTLEPLALPADRPRPPHMSGNGATEWLKVSPERVEALREMGQRSGVTLYMVLLTLFYVLLHRLNDQRDLIVKTPVRCRDIPEIEDVMGFFVNAVPLRVTVDPESTFNELLAQVRNVVLDAFACPDVPFEHLVIDLKPPRDESRPPISQATFSFQDVRERPTRWGNLEHQRLPVFQRGASDDIGMWFVELGHGLTGGITYNTDILESATVKRWAGYLDGLLEQVVASPERAVGDFELASGSTNKVQAPATAGVVDRPVGFGQPADLRERPGKAGNGHAEPPVAATRGSQTVPIGEETAESYMAGIWSELVGVERIRPSDNFFDIGGHSLLAVEFAMRVQRERGVRLRLLDIATGTLASLAAELSDDPPGGKNTGPGPLFGRLRRWFRLDAGNR